MSLWQRKHSPKAFLSRKRPKREGECISYTMKQAWDTVKKSLLEQNIIQKDTVDKSFIDGYISQMPFYTLAMTDYRFDILSPNSQIHKKNTIHIKIEFNSDYFTICNEKNTEFYQFKYDSSVIPILTSLQSGVVSWEFCKIIDSFRISLYLNGFIVLELIDYRMNIPKISYKLLKIHPCTFMRMRAPEFLSNEVESALLLTSTRCICMDPSPELARFESVRDWREKMWWVKNISIKVEQRLDSRHQVSRSPHVYKRKNINIL